MSNKNAKKETILDNTSKPEDRLERMRGDAGYYRQGKVDKENQKGGEPMNELTVLTERDIRENVNLIQRVMQAVMKKDVHYGLIPGCPKPSLFKPGAEKIASTFRIAVTSEVEDLSTPDEKRYRVTCTAYSASGNRVGSSVGECSSSEEKYRWRRPACDAEWEAADGDRKREKWLKDGSKLKQVRTEPADLANTILQMADKRAYVAVVRKVTAASDVFTQDIEDLPDEVQADIAAQPQRPTNGKPDVPMPTAKQPESSNKTGALCQGCDIGVTDKVAKYSQDNFGKVLCFNCQKETKGASKS